MIKQIKIVKLFNKEEPNEITLNDRLFIVTGDNGAGKTTLLNLAFFALNANFENFIKVKFEEIEVSFLENKLSLNSLVITKKPKKIVATYHFATEIVEIYTTIHSNGNYFEYKKLSGSLYNNDFDDNNETLNEGIGLFFEENFEDNIDDLINENKDLFFITEIRNSILYFPSYRRIDSDLESLKNAKPTFKFDDYLINNKNGASKNKDRRVIGVKEEDIEKLFSNYSNELRNYNSKGLDELLKTFIEGVIKDLYTPNGIKLEQDADGQQAEHLLDLAEKLGIDNIDKEKVYEYYEKSKVTFKDIEALNEIDSDMKKLDKNKVKKIDKKRKEKEVTEQIKILNRFLQVFEKDKKHVNWLVTLYMKHLQGHEEELKTYNYLKEAFIEFFNSKITVDINLKDYTVSMSKKYSTLSTGQKQMVTFLTYSALNLNDNVFSPIIVIDEPELSLHVSWQSKLVKQLLKKENTSLIIATHSPYVAKTMYSNSTYQIGDIDESY